MKNPRRQGIQVALATSLMIKYLALGGLDFEDVTPISFLNPSIFGAVDFGDIDNDGDLDLVVSGANPANGNSTYIYRNLGNGNFEQLDMAIEPARSGSVQWGDYNNDGYLDLILTGLNSKNASHVYRNAAGSGFTKVFELPVLYDGQAIWGDFDNDGDQDIAMVGTTSSATGRLTALYENVKRQSFRKLDIPLIQQYSGNIKMVDYDGDGYLDLFTAGTSQLSGSDGAFLYHNDGRGVFDAPTHISMMPNLRGAWFDSNNDNSIDLLLVDYVNARTELRTNSAPGGFTAQGIQLTRNLGSASVGDFDNNGFTDVLMMGLSFPPGGSSLVESTELWLNSGSGNWILQPTGLPVLTSTQVAVGDYDRDGDLDLVISGSPMEVLPTLRLLKNTATVSNTPPTIPSHPDGLKSEDTIKLSWAASFDSEQQGGLTYNVRMGTRPGAQDILNPMSLPSGTRKVARPGNAGSRTDYTIRNLTPGQTYYWSVQAIDNGFASSAFSEEKSFKVTHPCSIQGVKNLSLLEDFSSAEMAFNVFDQETDPTNIQVRAVSSNPQLISDDELLISGTGVKRSLRLKSRQDQIGHAVIDLIATDLDFGRTVASIQVEVLPTNDAPVTEAKSYLTREDRPIAVDLSGTDIDGDSLNFQIAKYPLHGLLSGQPPAMVYTPAHNFFGHDEFSFIALDGSTQSTPGTVRIEVTPVQDVKETHLTSTRWAPHLMRLAFTGEPYAAYELQWSENLVVWQTEKVDSSPLGLIIWQIDLRPQERRFFRVVPNP
ncbi:MAG: VCBS repeat-containing protein [Verrucomicrobiales bacterium]|nr:VCBS repeat-containing protein [Verrucomicrobiales bacterium]